MSALSNVHASTLLNTSLRSGTYYLALFLTDPTASGTGTEVSGGGYARKIINFSAPSLVSGKEQVSNSAPVDFGTLTADLGTVAYSERSYLRARRTTVLVRLLPRADALPVIHLRQRSELARQGVRFRRIPGDALSRGALQKTRAGGLRPRIRFFKVFRYGTA